MTDYRLGFTAQDNPFAHQLYQRLLGQGVTQAALDAGYTQANFGGAHCPLVETPSCRKGSGDAVIAAEEVFETALIMAEHNTSLRQLVEGVMQRPLPWVLDDLDPATTFDAGVRQRVTTVIRLLDTALRRQRLTPGTPAYNERMAVGIFYFAATPDPAAIAKMGAKFHLFVQELETLKLYALTRHLLRHGGLRTGGELRLDGKTSMELSALESLQRNVGECTEAAKVLYALLAMAGVPAEFVYVNPHKSPMPELREPLRKSPGYQHVCIGIPTPQGLRLLDSSVWRSDAPHKEAYPVSPRQFWSVDINNHALWTEQTLGRGAAIRELGLALLLDPVSPVAVQNRGLLYSEEQDLPAALRDFDASIRWYPGLSVSYANRGIVLEKLGRSDEALRDYETAITLDDGLAMAYFLRGDLHFKRGMLDKALADYDRGLAIDPDYALGYVQKGQVWRTQKEWKKATAAFSRAIQLDPKLVEAWLYRGQVRFDRGRWRGAIKDMTQVTLLQPTEVQAYWVRGQAFAHRKDWTRALADYDHVVAAAPVTATIAATVRVARGVAYGESGDRQRAMTEYAEAIRLNPEYGEAYGNRGVSLAHLKQWAEAEADYTIALRLLPKEPRLYYNRGIARTAQGHWDAGGADFVGALRLASNAPRPMGESIVSALVDRYTEYWAEASRHPLQQGFETATGLDLPKAHAIATLAGYLWEAAYPALATEAMEQVVNAFLAIDPWTATVQQVTKVVFERLPAPLRALPPFVALAQRWN